MFNRFRWVYCQMQELKKSKSTSPKSILLALRSLPSTLDDTYARMLLNISATDRSDALKLLRWITYAKSPRTLEELVDIRIIDPDDETSVGKRVDIANRGNWTDALAMLGGLVVTESAEGLSKIWKPLTSKDDEDDFYLPQSSEPIRKSSVVRLAHFSVKEYLESTRLLYATSTVNFFHLVPAREHRFLAQSCLVYMENYRESSERILGYCESPVDTSDTEDSWESSIMELELPYNAQIEQEDPRCFRLVRYAANAWFFHSALQKSGPYTRELNLLREPGCLRAWLRLYDRRDGVPRCPRILGSALYYACLVGLPEIAQMLINMGEHSVQGDLKAVSFQYRQVFDTSLHAATSSARAAPYRDFGTPLYAIAPGARFATYRDFGTPLYVATPGATDDRYRVFNPPWHVAKPGPAGDQHQDPRTRVFSAKPRVAARLYRETDTPLYAAIHGGHASVVKLLLVQNKLNSYGPALEVAAYEGHARIVEILLKQSGSALHAAEALRLASSQGHSNVVRLLIENYAGSITLGETFGLALQNALSHGQAQINPTALVTAVKHMRLNTEDDIICEIRERRRRTKKARPYEEIAKLLLARGADPNSPGGIYGSPLQAASFNGHTAIVEMLLNLGVDVNARGGRYGTALQAAAKSKNIEIVRLLLRSGADVNVEGGVHGTAMDAVYCCLPDSFGDSGITAEARLREAELANLLVQYGAKHLQPEEIEANPFRYPKSLRPKRFVTPTADDDSP